MTREQNYEVFCLASGNTIAFVKSEQAARQLCNANQFYDFEHVKGFWQDCYNDYSVQERFVRVA